MLSAATSKLIQNRGCRARRATSLCGLTLARLTEDGCLRLCLTLLRATLTLLRLTQRALALLRSATASELI